MSAIKRNVAWLMVSQLATWVVSVSLLILAPKKLAAEGFGRINFVGAFVAFFGLVGSLGTGQYLVKAIARDHATIGPLVRSALRLKVVLGLALSAIVITSSRLLGHSGEVTLLMAIACFGMVLSLINEIMANALAGMERMAKSALLQTAQTYVASGGAILVLFTSKSLVAYVAALAVATVIPVIGNYRLIRPYLRESPDRSRVPWKPMIVGGVPLLLLTVLNLVYGTIDIPILESVSGSEVVGWYSLAYRWVGMPVFITTIVVAAFFPRLSALAKQDPTEFAALTNRALQLVLFVTLPISLGLSFVARDLLDLLYNNEFDESVLLIRILVFFMPLATVNTVLATALIAADRQRRFVYVALIAAIGNPLLAFTAIHITDNRYQNGALGAAIITVVTEIFVTTCTVRMRHRGVLDRGTLWFITRVLMACGAMVPVLLLTDGLGLFVRSAVGGVTFVVAAMALRLVSIDSVRSGFGDIVRSRSGGQQQDPDTPGAPGALSDSNAVPQ